MNRIKELRLKKGWLQSDLAQLLNARPQSISNYELGTRGLDIDTVLKLCDIFECTADYLLCRTDLPSAELTEEESALIAAFRRSDERARDMVRLALEPFREEGSEGKAI